METEPTPQTTPTSSAKSVNPIRLLVIAGILVVIFGGIWAAAMNGALDSGLNLFAPRLVPARGSVTYKNAPVKRGIIRTEYLDGKTRGAFSPLDEQGRFEFKTDDQPGAMVGRHRVLVFSTTETFPPRPLIPVKYSDAKGSPLTITVTSSGPNEFQFALEGDVPESEGRGPAALGGRAGGPRANSPPAEAGQTD